MVMITNIEIEKERVLKTINKYLLASVITVVLASPAIAMEMEHDSCGDKATVQVRKMGMMNEEALQIHMDKVKQQLKKVRHARGSQKTQKRELRMHLSEMKSAMQELHNQMYVGGCKTSMHGASADVRIEVMEKRLDMMQQMMEQMIEHLSEKEE